MIIRKEIDLNKPLSEEQRKMLEESKTRPIVPDEDCPELTDEQLARFAADARERNRAMQNKQTVAIAPPIN